MLFEQVTTFIFFIQDKLLWLAEKAFLSWQGNYLVYQLNSVALIDAAISKSSVTMVSSNKISGFGTFCPQYNNEPQGYAL